MLHIAANDAGLAHGAARYSIASLAERVAHLEQRLNGRPIPECAKILRRAYGALLIEEHIVRPGGSRARASWTALDSDGDELVPIVINRWNAGNWARVTGDCLRIRIRRHALARLYQRTIGTGDVQAAAPILAAHVTQAAVALTTSDVVAGKRLITETPAGRMIWQAVARPSGVTDYRARTWLASGAVQ